MGNAYSVMRNKDHILDRVKVLCHQFRKGDLPLAAGCYKAHFRKFRENIFGLCPNSLNGKRTGIPSLPSKPFFCSANLSPLETQGTHQSDDSHRNEVFESYEQVPPAYIYQVWRTQPRSNPRYDSPRINAWENRFWNVPLERSCQIRRCFRRFVDALEPRCVRFDTLSSRATIIVEYGRVPQRFDCHRTLRYVRRHRAAVGIRNRFVLSHLPHRRPRFRRQCLRLADYCREHSMQLDLQATLQVRKMRAAF